MSDQSKDVTPDRTDSTLRTVLGVGVLITAAVGFVLASEIILILFLGVLFSVFLSRIAGWLAAKSKLPRSACLWGVVVLLLAGLVGGSTAFFVEVNDQIQQASDQIDAGIDELRTLIAQYPAIESFVARVPFVSDSLVSEEVRAATEATNLSDVPKPVQSAVKSLGGIFQTTFGLAINSLLILFTGLFLAIDPAMYRDGAVQLFPPSRRDRMRDVFDQLGDSLWRWLVGRFGSMVVTGLGAFVLLWFLGVPLAGTLAVITALLTFVPNIGSAIALMLAILFALPQGGMAAVWVVVGYSVLQLLESYVITPMIQQTQAALPPALLIASQAIMGVLFGFIGAAVASPLLAATKKAIQLLYVEDVLERESA